MIKIKHQGRFGNRLLTTIGISILSRKTDLKVLNYDNRCLRFGLQVHQGDRSFETLKYIGDDDVLRLLDKVELIEYGLECDGLFQSREFISTYEEEIKQTFVNLIYSDDFMDDLFVHVRLGNQVHLNPGFNYYQNCINQINFKRGFISSDSPNNKIVQDLITMNNLTLINLPAEEVISFGKNFGNLILSNGTFSWWIGFLSKAKIVFYPEMSRKWHGDIFIDPTWNGVKIRRSLRRAISDFLSDLVKVRWSLRLALSRNLWRRWPVLSRNLRRLKLWVRSRRGRAGAS
jgi:hypothetical protein